MLSLEEVKKIAHLARLELSADELSVFQARLGRVLEFMRELETLPTPPEGFIRHIPRDAVGFREDHEIASQLRDALLKNAPSVEDHQFLLPTVLEEKA